MNTNMPFSHINAAQGIDGSTMVFYVDTMDGNSIRQYVANPGPEKMRARNYIGPDMVMNSEGQNYTTKSSDLAVVSYMDGNGTPTIRIYYIGSNGKMRELYRDSRTMDNTGAWKDGDLNHSNLEAANDSPVSACYDDKNKQLKVFYYGPKGNSPCVAFQEDNRWVSRPIAK